jgi:hypothetical protein
MRRLFAAKFLPPFREKEKSKSYKPLLASSAGDPAKDKSQDMKPMVDTDTPKRRMQYSRQDRVSGRGTGGRSSQTKCLGPQAAMHGFCQYTVHQPLTRKPKQKVTKVLPHIFFTPSGASRGPILPLEPQAGGQSRMLGLAKT